MGSSYRRGVGIRLAAAIIIIVLIIGIGAYYIAFHGKGGKTLPTGGTITIGFTAPLTGPNKAIGESFLRGIKLWALKVNSQGGINVHGRGYRVVLKYYDDGGNPAKTKQLYVKLIEKDKVDYLISPPLDQCAFQAINIAEEYGKLIMVVTPGEELFRGGLKYSYQIVTPGSRFFIPILELAKSIDPNSTKIALVFLDNPASRVMASGITVWAGGNGYSIVFEYFYPAGTKDFRGIATVLASKAPDIILGGGGVNETISLVKALYEAGVRPKLIALLDAPLTEQFKSLGNLAIGVMGVSEWETVATYSAFKAKQLNATWYGPSMTEFTVDYEKKYGVTPTSVSASGYAAGLILQYGIEKAGSLNTGDIEKVLDNARLLTFYGLIQFDNTPELHGLQIAHEPIVIQWMEKGGNLVKLVVAPRDFAVAAPIYPLPWS